VQLLAVLRADDEPATPYWRRAPCVALGPARPKGPLKNSRLEPLKRALCPPVNFFNYIIILTTSVAALGKLYRVLPWSPRRGLTAIVAAPRLGTKTEMNMNMKNDLYRLMLGACLVVALAPAGCSEDPSPPGEEVLSASEVMEHYIRDGITCETAARFVALDHEAQSEVIEGLLAEIGGDGIHHLLELGGGCEPAGDLADVAEFDPAGVVEPAPRHISNSSGKGEWVEETSFDGGNQALGIYRDGAGAGWMCNSGSSESPADFIALFSVSGAYNNRGALRVRGSTPWAWAYIPGGLSSRVYSDNHVASCIGYWSVTLTGSIAPLAWELYMKR
jgi:hypothetical protein